MPRAATTSDAFNAVAEPRRRDILNYLALQESSVTDIVDAMEMRQSSVSKHLKVLKGVGLVEARREGQAEIRGGRSLLDRLPESGKPSGHLGEAFKRAFAPKGVSPAVRPG